MKRFWKQLGLVRVMVINGACSSNGLIRLGLVRLIINNCLMVRLMVIDGYMRVLIFFPE